MQQAHAVMGKKKEQFKFKRLITRDTVRCLSEEFMDQTQKSEPHAQIHSNIQVYVIIYVYGLSIPSTLSNTF